MADEFSFRDIPWGLPPAPAPEPSLDVSTPDLIGILMADYLALEAHCASQTQDARTYRELLALALVEVRTLRARVERLEHRIVDQQAQIAALLGIQ